MSTTRLSSKGQVILPKSIRDARGWRPGLEFLVEEREDDILLRPMAEVPATSVSDLLGCLGYRGPRRSIEEMDASVALITSGGLALIACGGRSGG